MRRHLQDASPLAAGVVVQEVLWESQHFCQPVHDVHLQLRARRTGSLKKGKQLHLDCFGAPRCPHWPPNTSVSALTFPRPNLSCPWRREKGPLSGPVFYPCPILCQTKRGKENGALVHAILKEVNSPVTPKPYGQTGPETSIWLPFASTWLPKSLKHPTEKHSKGEGEVLGLRKKPLPPGKDSNSPSFQPTPPTHPYTHTHTHTHTHPIIVKA